jgi:hypothetical protein
MYSHLHHGPRENTSGLDVRRFGFHSTELSTYDDGRDFSLVPEVSSALLVLFAVRCQLFGAFCENSDVTTDSYKREA